MSDLYASTTPPVQRLRKFTRVHLQPRETRRVSFTLTLADLALVDGGGRQVVEPGEFSVRVADLTASFQFHGQRQILPW